MATTKFFEEKVAEHQKLTRTAATAILAHSLVKTNATNYDQIDQAAAGSGASGDVCLGVVRDVAAIGAVCEVCIAGVVMVLAGGTVALNDLIVSDAAGKGIAAITTATVLFKVIGRALAGAASGELFPMLISQFQTVGSNAS